MIGEMTVALKVKKTWGSPSDAGAARSGSPRDGAPGRKAASDPSAGPSGSSTSTWYRRPRGGSGPRGRPRDPLAPVRVEAVRELCGRYPFWGYKRIAVVARRDVGPGYSDRLTYRIMRELNLLQKRAPRRAELRQTRHLLELLPSRPNDLWQMDVTWIHLP